MKKYLATNLRRNLNNIYQAEHFKDTNKGKADNAKASKSAELATSQQAQYQQTIKECTRKNVETSEFINSYNLRKSITIRKSRYQHITVKSEISASVFATNLGS